jgi:hypothetical protein
MPLQKVRAKKLSNFEYFGFCAFFRGFLLLTYVRGIFESRQEKIFLGHNSTFYNIKMQMRKKMYIFKHFAKSKKLFFCQYLSFSM